MKKVQKIPISTMRDSPKRQSYTQPQSLRVKTCSEECERKECLTNKWNLLQMAAQNKSYKEEAEKYREMYLKERKLIGNTYKEIEKIMNVIQEKEKTLNEKEQSLLNQSQAHEEERKALLYLKETIDQLNADLQGREKSLVTDQKLLEDAKETERLQVAELQQLKKALTESITILEGNHQYIQDQIFELNQQEVVLMRKIEHLNIFSANFDEHQNNMSIIEKVLQDKQNYIQNLSRSVLGKAEELAYADQQLHVRGMCTTLNEAALVKKVASQDCFKTPSINKAFFKDSQENNAISTIASREISPSNSSFKLIKKNFYTISNKTLGNINNLY